MVTNRRRTRTNWISLPDELQKRVLEFLPPAALRRACLASQAWAKLVLGPALANKRHLTLGGPLADSDAEVEAALQRCPRLTSLTLLQPVSNAALASLALQPHLTKLVCCLRSEPAFQPQLAALEALTGLRSLHIACFGNAWGRRRLDLSALTGLISLHLSGYSAVVRLASLRCVRGLTELHLLSALSSNIVTVVDAAQVGALAQLRSLRLGGSCSGLEARLAQLSVLTALTLLHLPHLYCGGFMRELLRPLTALADLCANASATEPDVVAITPSLTALTKLELDFNPGINAEPLHQLLSALPGLAELQVQGTRAAHTADLALLTGLTALTVLCPKDSRAAVSHVAAATQLRRLMLCHLRRVSRTAPLHLPLLTELQLLFTDINLALLLPALSQQTALRSLWLTPCRHVQHLSGLLAACTALTALRLACHCKKSDGAGAGCLDAAGLACLATLPELAQLTLREVALPRPGGLQPRPFIANLARSRSLRQLTLQGVHTGNLDCHALAAMGSLECIEFQRTRDGPPDVWRPPRSGLGLAALLAAGCRVVYDDYATQ